MKNSRRLRRVVVDEVGLQIAPMIDVTLLLLFFFMLSGKLSGEGRRRDLDLPVVRTESRAASTEGFEVIHVTQEGELLLGERSLSRTEWGALLRRKRGERGHLKLLVRAEASTPVGKIRAILQTAAEAGVQEVVYAVRPL